MSAREILLEVAEKLQPDATLVDAIYELEFRQAVEDGLASLDRGERITLEEARKRVPQWVSKYSSHRTNNTEQSLEIVRFWHGARGFPHIPAGG